MSTTPLDAGGREAVPLSASRAALRRSFVDPHSLVFWVGLGLVVYGAVHIVPLLAQTLRVYPSASNLAVVLWAGYGSLLLVLLYRLELFGRRSMVTLCGAYAWGAVAVPGLAAVASGPTNDLLTTWFGNSIDDQWISAITAAIVEEPLKALGVLALALIPAARLRNAMDGLYYGLIIGLGFEVTESLLYSMSASFDQGGLLKPVVLTFILRGLIGGLWNHPTFTAITGAGIGYFVNAPASRGRRVTVLVATMSCAMALHAFFDSPILESDNALTPTLLKGLPILVLFVVVFRVSRARERRQFLAVGHDHVDPELVSEQDLATLATRKSRRGARRAVRRSGGFAASHALRRLQRRQVELVAAIADGRPLDDVEVVDVIDEVVSAKRVLAEVTTAT